MQSYITSIELALISLLHTGKEHASTVKSVRGYFELNLDRSVLMYIKVLKAYHSNSAQNFKNTAYNCVCVGKWPSACICIVQGLKWSCAWFKWPGQG